MSEKLKNAPETTVGDRPVAELFLLHLRYKEATLQRLGNDRPLLLDQPQAVWVIYTGRVDLFVVPLRDGAPAGARTHLARLHGGQALFGLDLAHSAETVGLLAVGDRETSLLRVPVQRLQALHEDEEFRPLVTALVDDWVGALSDSLVDSLPPRDALRLRATADFNLSEASNVCARDGVVWVRHERGHSRYLGRSDLPLLNGTGYWPLTSRTWLQASEPAEVRTYRTTDLPPDELRWPYLQEFHQLVLHSLENGRTRSAEAAEARLQQKLATNRAVIGDALERLSADLGAASLWMPESDGQSPLIQACRLVGQTQGIDIVAPPAKRLLNSRFKPLEEIARASRVQMRQVALRDGWWLRENGPLLGFVEDAEGRRPVALLPARRGYRAFDPGGRADRPVDDEYAAALEPFAFMFYRPMPARPLNAVDLLRFGLKGNGGTLRSVLLLGLLVSLLGLAIPMATGIVIDRIIPGGDANQLLQVVGLLILLAVVATLLQIAQNISVLRLQGRVGATVEAALWDRVLNLPVSFFRHYTAGDLGSRVMAIKIVEQLIAGALLPALLAGLLALTSLGLMIYYNVWLAAAGIGLGAGLLVATLIFSQQQLRHERAASSLMGHLAGQVLQVVNGIPKFRAAGAESYAFASWAQEYSRLRQRQYRARDIGNGLTVFQGSYTILCTMVLFAVVAFYSGTSLTTGQFLAFNVTFIQFLGSVLAMSQAYVAVRGATPAYERARPLLEAVPEVDAQKEDPGELRGAIDVSHVSFRYDEEGPLILHDVSLHAAPGEFIALVGPSGSGKSTLFRLLLGFESAQTGSVYYDGRDLAHLDVREVRRQLGVVLQNGRIMAGNLFSNIIGSSQLTLQDAAEAAQAAGLAEDVASLPMGMHTVLSDGGGTLSGGQRQRVLIARAIVHKPRILYFDEATSALDNRTQAIVSQSLENLQATRVVIAHRLSTIANADRIFVMDQGRVVQTGTYAELLDQPGLFAELARRQMS